MNTKMDQRGGGGELSKTRSRKFGRAKTHTARQTLGCYGEMVSVEGRQGIFTVLPRALTPTTPRHHVKVMLWDQKPSLEHRGVCRVEERGCWTGSRVNHNSRCY